MENIPVGRVVSAHGIKGEVKFLYYNDEKEVFYGYTSFLVKNANNRWMRLRPTEINVYRGFFYLKFHGLDSLEAVSFMLDQELFVKQEQLPSLKENEYYEYQLIGLNVVGHDDIPIGSVKHIMHTNAQDLIVVDGEKELLVPMVEGFIVDINIEKSTIKIKADDLFL